MFMCACISFKTTEGENMKRKNIFGPDEEDDDSDSWEEYLDD